MSGMPAWGVTHDDESIWGLVAFLQTLSDLDAAGYAALTGSQVDASPEAREVHAHSDGAGHDH